MFYVSLTELRKKLGFYIELSKKEDVFVMKNKKVISVLTNPQDIAFTEFMKLGGILKTDKDLDDLLFEKKMERWNN